MRVALVAAVLACSKPPPPKPPAVDESTRRPANTAMAVELQVCKNDLQNTRLLVTESGRLAETTAATLANLAFKIGAAAILGSARLRLYVLTLGGSGLAAGIAILLVWPAAAGP